MDERPRIEYADPVRAMRAVFVRMARYGAHYDLPDHVLGDLVRAVLDCADGVDEVSRRVPSHIWPMETARQYARSEMRANLLDHIFSHGHVPTALPKEEISYHSLGLSVDDPFGEEIPAEAVAAGAVPFYMVRLTLWCPVRIPPVDRAAAVKAGLL